MNPQYEEHKSKEASRAQQNSLHLACERLAKTLNDAGLDQRTVLAASVEIPWTKMACKEQLYKTILKVMENKASTTEMDSVEPSAVWDVLCKHLATTQGIIPPSWPDRHGPIDQYYNGEDL